MTPLHQDNDRTPDGSDETIGLAGLAEMLVDVYGSGTWRLTPFPPDRKAIDIGDYYGDCSKARRTLGWAPRINRRDGLTRTLEYYSSRLSEYWVPA